MAAFDYVVVGGGSAGAVIAARLSEDPAVQVCLLEAGQAPPAAELMPAACASLQLDPMTDWMFTGDPGRGGRGLRDGRMHQPRGKMLGGSSGINYMAYVRGHPGDYDAWAAKGATGWSYQDVLPYFRKSERLAPVDHIPSGCVEVDEAAHGTAGPMGVSVRNPVLPASLKFLDACRAAGYPVIDYNGTNRNGKLGGCALFQTTTYNGRRTSTYRAFLEPVLQRPNLRIITGALATKIVLEKGRATGVQFRLTTGESVVASARREVVVSAGAYGSPQLLLLSGIGPKAELEALKVPCLVDNAHVGKHLKDHIQLGLLFPAPGSGISMVELLVAMGPQTLRTSGVLPASSLEDAGLPEELEQLKANSEQLHRQWAEEGTGLAASSIYDAVLFTSSGLRDEHSHDLQMALLACGYAPEVWRELFRVDPAEYFGPDCERILDPKAENILFLANPVLPRSEGEVRLASAEATAQPDIRLNYFADPGDMQVTLACVRKVLELAAKWPGGNLGPLLVPHRVRQRHNYRDGDPITDALIEDWALDYALTVYHPTSTCRIGDVVGARLRVLGVEGLRVADASIMPDIVAGNTNAATIMIGEKAAELIAVDGGVALADWAVPPTRTAPSARM